MKQYITLIFLASFLLTGCQTSPPLQSLPSTPPSAAPVSNWHWEGQVGFKTAAQSGSGSITWTQSGEQFEILFWGPLGSAKTHITGSPVSVSLEQGNQTFTAPTAEALMLQHLGWSVPVEHMKFWILGQPNPALPFVSVTQNHFSQSGWEIVSIEKQSQNGLSLPRKIKFTHQDTEIKLVIHQWSSR